LKLIKPNLFHYKSFAKYKNKKIKKAMTKFKQETSGSKPFLWTREEWDENAEKSMVKTETEKVKIDLEMVKLKGIEPPEQFMLWLKDYEDKILHNTKTTLLDRPNVLKNVLYRKKRKLQL
jgi:hypothetical protein